MREGYETSDRAARDDSRSGDLFYAGLCAGAAVGAGIALLFAPRTGSQLREQLADSAAYVATVVSKTVDALTDRGQEMSKQVDSMLSQTGDEIARATDGATHAGKGLATLGEMAALHGEEWRVAIRG